MTLLRLKTNDGLSAEKSSKCFGLQTLRLCTEKSSYNRDINGGEGGQYDLSDFSPSQSDYLSFLNQFLNEDFGHYSEETFDPCTTADPVEGCGTEDQGMHSDLRPAFRLKTKNRKTPDVLTTPDRQ
jgi:hypothetical protein